MPTFTVTYKNGEAEDLEAFSRDDLIKQHFDDSDSHLKKKVKMITWHHNTIQFVEDVETGQIDKEVSTADANPYGWREKGDSEDDDYKGTPDY